MAVTNTNSTQIANAVAKPRIPNTPAQDTGAPVSSIAQLTMASGDSNKSTYRFMRCRSGDTVKTLKMALQIGTSTAGVLDVGLYAADTGAVVDQRFFATGLAGALTSSGAAISAITAASPGVFTTSAAHGLAVGERILIQGVVGMVQVNGLVFTVATVPSTTTFTVAYGGVALNTTGFTAWASGGTIYVPPFYNSWTEIAPQVTAVPDAGAVITGATAANPCVLTVTAKLNQFVAGQQVKISGVVGMTQLNGNTYTITAATSTTLTLNVDSSAFTAYSSAGLATQANALSISNCDQPIWKILGLSQDPFVEYDVVITATTAVATAALIAALQLEVVR